MRRTVGLRAVSCRSLPPCGRITLDRTSSGGVARNVNWEGDSLLSLFSLPSPLSFSLFSLVPSFFTSSLSFHFFLFPPFFFKSRIPKI